MNEEIIEKSPSRIYQAQLDQGVFEIQVCEDCGKYVFYPRMMCPYCGSHQLLWSKPSGLGTVYSTTCVRTPADPIDHYNICLVDLDEGVRLMSCVEGMSPDEVCIGMRVRASVKVVDEKGMLFVTRIEEEK